MQGISSVKRKTSGDTKLNILVLQTVTVAIIILFAIGIRLFGGDVYKRLSLMYHEKFDDITTTTEVLEPATDNAASEPQSKGSAVSESSDIIDTDTSSDQESHSDGTEEFDPDIDSELTGNITELKEVQSHAVAAPVNSLQWPVVGTISSHYGYRTHPITGVYSMHNGLDIAADKGTEIIAAYAGEVTSAGYSSSYGYYVIISHDQSMKTLYAHCSKLLVNEGDMVEKGDKIALVGSTGRATGPHLHFEVRVSNYRIDPEWLLSELRDV